MRSPPTHGLKPVGYQGLGFPANARAGPANC